MSGDRGNILIKNNGVFLFTAKDGKRLPKLLKRALERGRSRWGDSNSFARVVFGELVQREALDSTASYAIGTEPMENDNYVLAVDDIKQTIGLFSDSGQPLKISSYVAGREVHKTVCWTFDEFLAMTDEQLEWTVLDQGIDYFSFREPTRGRTTTPFEI